MPPARGGGYRGVGGGGAGGGGQAPLSQPQRYVILSFLILIAYLFCLQLYGEGSLLGSGGSSSGDSGRTPMLEAVYSGGRSGGGGSGSSSITAAAQETEMIREREMEAAAEDARKEAAAKAKADAEAKIAKAEAEAADKKRKEEEEEAERKKKAEAEAAEKKKKEEEEAKAAAAAAAAAEQKEKEAKAAAAAAAAANPVDNPEAQCLAQDWVQKHAALQREMQEGKRPKRFLVLRPDCGYCGACNRLNSMLGTYLWAVITDRAFVIDWRYPGKHGWKEGTHYLDPRVVNWTADAMVGRPTFEWPDYRMVEGWDVIRDKLKDEATFEGFERDDAIILKMLGEYPAQWLNDNEPAKERARARGLLAPGETWDQAWHERFKACAFRVLFQPAPQLTKHYCHRLGPERRQSSIGVHVRTGDDTWTNMEYGEPKDEHLRFADCAAGFRRALKEEGLLEKAGEAEEADASSSVRRVVDVDRWHVASDMQKVVDAIREAYPDFTHSIDTLGEEDGVQDENVRVHSANTVHEQFTLGPLLDLVSLSSALAVVGTCNSTFSASASVIGMIPPELTLLKRTNFEARYFHTFYCPEMPPVPEAEAFCHALVKRHRPLVEQVLRTPPFITCPAPGPGPGSDSYADSHAAAANTTTAPSEPA